MSKTRNRITLCMIVKDEAGNLDRCLKSVRGVADEIVVVDTGSTDSTVQIARRYGAEIVAFPWSGDFAAARNAGLTQARGRWILVLDADEELDESSRGELLLCAEHTEYEAFFLRIHNHKGTSRSSQTITVNPILRMFRNRPEYRFSGIIHEQIASVIVQAAPAAAMHLSTVVIHHYGYAAGVVAKRDKIRRNVELLKEQLKLSPGDAFHHFNMAVEYMRLGEYDHALEHIHTSLERADPDTSYIHLLYKYEIRCRAVKGDMQGALAACERGIALFPDYPDLYHLKGALLLQEADWMEAKAALRQALDIGASPPGYHTESGFGTYATWSLLGRLCQEIGEDREAAAFYTKAARLHPEPWLLLAHLVRTLKCAGRENELTGWLGLHIPEAAAEHRRLAVLLLNEGCYEAAARLLEKSRINGAVAHMEQSAAGAVELDSRGAQTGQAASAGPGEPLELPGAGWTAEYAAGAGSGHQAGAGPAVRGEAAAGPDGTGSFVQALREAAAAPAGSLSHGDVAVLLNQPCVLPQDAAGMTDNPAYQHSRTWILLADHALASLPASAAMSPAAGRARRVLPLPRVTD
ncbi:glycosyltransferase family 2 protein [Paenibacillus sp. S150]|uniref:tetratricopeptide repeat-containing glycosyltransferase family 2 protein n=1 Tax=Paenibacillus sp. S150 TaxID=2749826 RepID=UPI001C58FA1D|nr:glycosyltransferase family 2 protein [Paenibacillus sp. S150]MBW4085585.1 glycosyltransferase [Paenibacillus sp. S150]